MAAFLLLLLAPLLLLGTGQAQTSTEDCSELWSATEGNFSLEVTPETYQANTSYLVRIKDDRNHSSPAGTYLLLALSPQNASVGEWEGADPGKCGSVDAALLSPPENSARWTSPNRTLPSVQLRVYFSSSDNATELKTFMLNEGAGPTTSPSRSTPSSVCRAGSSSLLLSALLLLTGSLLS